MIRMCNILALVTIFLVASPTALKAQTSQDVFEIQFQKRETKRREVIVRGMMFEEQEAEKFWPMYDQYRATVKNFHRRRFVMLNKLTDSIVGMSEEFAEEIVEKALALEMEQQSAKGEFISKLKSILSKARYFRYYSA